MSLKKLKEKRFFEMIFLGVVAFGLLIAVYFVFINKDDVKDFANNNAVTMSQTESRLCAILSEIEGVGAINAYVNENELGEAESVILVFEGADNLSVRMDVLDAASQALGISRNSVLIYKMTK